MISSKLSYWTFRFSLIVALATFLNHESLRAGPPTPATPPQPGVVRSTGPTSGPASGTQTPAPTHDVTKPSEPRRPQTVVSSAATAVDYGTFQLGGSVYSSGTADVIVRVLDSTSISPVPPGHNSPKPSPFNQGLYLLSPGPARFIAFNKQAGTTINLGKLPPGELVFGLRVDEYNCYFQTGDVSRNPDRLHHVSKRTFKSSDLVELWFEDALGPKGTGRSDRDLNDLVISVSGGIDNGAMSDLAQAIQQQPAASREAIVTELKKVDPKTAAAVSSPRSAPAK